MRSRMIPFGAVLLAACGPSEPVNRSEAVVAPPPVVATHDGAAARPAPAPAPDRPSAAIPAPFHGVYDASREACGRPSDGRLTVTSGALRFHESIGTVRGVTAAGAGAVTVEADYQGEGESWRSVRELRLAEGGDGLTISGDGTTFARVRCPAGTG